jgi:hypothetical protein
MSNATVDSPPGQPARRASELDGVSMPTSVSVNEFKPYQRELLELYERARHVEGSLSFPNPDVVRGDLVGTYGQLQ